MTGRLMAIVAAALLLAGCAQSSAEVNAPDAWDEVQADPQLARGAERVLDDAPAPADGWRVGVVLTEAEYTTNGIFGEVDHWMAGVLTDAGMVVLVDCWCDDADLPGVRVLPTLVDPGDLITWSTAGDDEKVGASELRVLRKAAALESP